VLSRPSLIGSFEYIVQTLLRQPEGIYPPVRGRTPEVCFNFQCAFSVRVFVRMCPVLRGFESLIARSLAFYRGVISCQILFGDCEGAYTGGY